MVSAGFDEDGAAFLDRHSLPLDLEHASSPEHDVDLVVGVRLLTVGLRSDEDIDSEFESRRFVDDLVAAVAGLEPLPDLGNPKLVHADREAT